MDPDSLRMELVQRVLEDLMVPLLSQMGAHSVTTQFVAGRMIDLMEALDPVMRMFGVSPLEVFQAAYERAEQVIPQETTHGQE